MATLLPAQTAIHQISTGNGYGKSAYYKFADGASQQIAHDAWDIAFSNLGPQQAGIFVNESTASVNGQPGPAVEAYDPLVFDFNETIDPGILLPEQQLFNPEHSWAEGAFNTGRDTSNALDYGWGGYDPNLQKIVGYRVFALKLRDGTYRKISFDEYTGASFTFRVANLDGSNLSTHTINTTPGNGSPLVYFSLGAAGSNVPTATDWDLVFCRYVALLADGSGGLLPYFVTGVLTADGYQTARAAGIDPATVDHVPYLDSLSHRLDIIGHDWKYFDLTSGWSVLDNRAYFVKTKQNQLYKLVWVDFGGASTGTATLERTYLGELSAAPDLPAGISGVLVYPNPAADQAYLSLSATQASTAVLGLFDAAGKKTWSGKAPVHAGLTVLELPLSSLPAGGYTLRVELPGGQFARQVVVGR